MTISPINTKDACDHPITIRDFCGVCGRDLREKDGIPGDKTEEASANVSMVHHIPELRVSNKLSREYGGKDRDMLLNSRKLALLVDLDGTLVHTSNRPPTKSEVCSDIVQFDMCNTRFYTKIRPHTASFFRKISHYYELHVVTFGTRSYAHKIARMLDPERKYFHNRILSRDELVSNVHKTRNLKSLFPLGDELLVMIDDRPDVWEFSDALIRVKPYVYFKKVGDINATPSKKLKLVDAGSIGKCDQETEVCDEDNSLLDVQRILLEIHARYYEKYEKEKKVNDVKQTMAALRSKVFQDDEIFLTGINPRIQDPEMHWVCEGCSTFGAKVVGDVTETTTVIVSVKSSTVNLEKVRSSGIPVVDIKWLLTCFYKWQRADKKGYEFIQKADRAREALSVSHLNSIELPIMGAETLNEMADEVNEVLSESDVEDDDSMSESCSSNDDDEMARAIEKHMNTS